MKQLRADAPFVLLEDARPGAGPARLFAYPREIIAATALAEVAPALERMRAALKGGAYLAGWMGYEAGLAFEARLARLRRAGPLLWFGVFDGVTRIASEQIANILPDGAGAWLSPPRPRLMQTDYAEAFARAKRYITAGDIYQVNLSYRADVTLLGEPLAAYARLRESGGGGWSGVVFDGTDWLLSTSPELFFHLRDGVIEARPMKGTARRVSDPATDRRAAEALRNDPKERAENVMIVDLLRNDISRLAKRGSVRAPDLFAVETYPTLHALTSTVRGELRAGYDAIDALRALFPCGSITGAPKIRAMEIIGELETDRRGAYTGSIGWIGPDGEAAFNVAIRTLAIEDGRAELGLGSGVVYDSDIEREWEECRAKGAFVTSGAAAFDLIETMGFTPQEGVRYLDLHLARLRASASAFGFRFDEPSIRARLQEALASQAAARVRLLLSADGSVRIEVKPPARFADAVVRVTAAPLPVAASDFRLRHKTTLRDFYDRARARAATEEVVFFDAAGFLTEGSFSNIFVERDGVLLTPPAARGLLPGVLRAHLLANGKARESDLRLDDLVRGFFLGNATRGLTPARLVPDAASPRTRADEVAPAP